MATYSKIPLSGSLNGKQIIITAVTSGSANPIHTAVDGAISMDEVWLYAYNDATASLQVSILWGGTIEPNNVYRSTIPSRSGRTLIADGVLLQNGNVISAYAQASASIMIDGFVNRIV